ncbi:MAG TPA: HAMP domain-containing protein, partial [Nitrospirae bacterium]|nr:HAMP domain-containing protein [Nitrospirota bacterium]
MNLKLEFKIVGMVIITLLIGAVSIGFMSIKFLRTDMNNLVDTYTGEAITFMKHAIEETMITGNAEITEALTNKQKESGNVKSITILNALGQEAFTTTGKSLPADVAITAQIRESRTTFVKRLDDMNIYYVPLIKNERCLQCHDTQDEVLGALKIAMSVKGVNNLLAYRTKVVVLSLIFGILILGTALWIAFKKAVINPVKELQRAAHSLAGGDFSFKTNIRSRDEIGMLNDDMSDAIKGIGNILQRIGAVARRVKTVSIAVEKESKKVAEGTQLETEAIDNMLSGIEEFNRSVLEIADNVAGLSVSSEQTAASVDETSTNAEEITKNTVELSSAVETTSSSIEEMSANIREIALKTEGLSSSAEETLSAIEEINSSVKEIESNARESAKLSEKVTADASGFGMESVNKTEEGMERIKTTVQKTAEFIGKLGGRSDEIGKILNVIDEITDQTALLALNAAILAAQAGEHGKGFSVVADEIKDLAERTSYSTQEISSLIQAVQQEVQGAVSTMGDGLKTVEEGARLSRESKNALQKII